MPVSAYALAHLLGLQGPALGVTLLALGAAILVGPQQRRKLGAPDPRVSQCQQREQLRAALEREHGRPGAMFDDRRAEQLQTNGHRWVEKCCERRPVDAVASRLSPR